MAPQTGQVGGRTGYDSTAVNRLTPAPDAVTAPDADLIANASSQAGAAVSNAYNRPAAPPVEESVTPDVPPVAYANPSGRISVQRIGPGVGKGGI